MSAKISKQTLLALLKTIAAQGVKHTPQCNFDMTAKGDSCSCLVDTSRPSCSGYGEPNLVEQVNAAIASIERSGIPRSDAKDAQRYRAALERIAAIEDKMVGGDWEEIEEARKIANEALSAPTGAALEARPDLLSDGFGSTWQKCQPYQRPSGSKDKTATFFLRTVYP